MHFQSHGDLRLCRYFLHLRREEPQRMKNMIPDHVWQLTAPYGLTSDSQERKPVDESDAKVQSAAEAGA